MSQAEALLNSLMETVIDHTHEVPDSDTHFIIDPYTRQIENTNYNKTVLMRGDHNSERFTFELPRYVDGHDMSLCNRVIVHFDNVGDSIENIYSDVAYMDDLHINPNKPETVISSWLIRREATQIVGILSFSLQYQCVENEEVTYEWNTDSYDEIEIRKSKNNGEAAIIQYTNVLEQWRSQIFGAGDSVLTNITTEGANQVAAVQTESATQQAAIELKGSKTLATIPEDYTEVYNMASEAVRTKADGIVCKAEGSAITINDSSDDYLRGLNVYGKSTQVITNGYQLFDASRIDSVTMGGATVTNNKDGSFTVGGNGTLAEPFAKYYEYTHEETIKLLRAGSLFIKTENRTQPYMYAQIVVDSITVGTVSNREAKTGELEILQEWMDNETAILRCGFFGNVDASISTNFNIKPMLYQDGDGTWEPYSAGDPSPNPEYPQEIVSVDKPVVNFYGKNLLEFKHEYNYVPEGVIMVEELDNGAILQGSDGVVPGGSTYSSGWYQVMYRNRIPLKAGTRVTFSADYTVLENPHATTAKISLHFSAKNSYSMNDSIPRPADGIKTRIRRTVTIEKDEEYFITVGLNSCKVRIENLQLEVSDVATDYEPFVQPQSLVLANTLHGIPVTSGGNYTDDNGQQWICDEVYLEREMYIQRVNTYIIAGNETMMASAEKWQKDGMFSIYMNALSPATKYASDDVSLFHYSLSEKCVSNTWEWMQHSGLNNIAARKSIVYMSLANSVTGILAEDDNATKLSKFKAYLTAQYTAGTPITVQYILATPIETPLTAEEIATYKTLKTNYPNTTILNDSNAWMKVKYNADIKLYFAEDKQKLITDIVDQLRDNVTTAKISTVTLKASEWEGEDNLYSQVVSIDGVTSNSQVDLTPSVEQLETFYYKDVSFVAENDGGVVTVYAIGQKPMNDYTIQVTITEVDV